LARSHIVIVRSRNQACESSRNAFAAEVEPSDGIGGACSGEIFTSWQAARGSKRTEVRFSDGCALRIEHTALALEVVDGANVIHAWAARQDVPTAIEQYRSLYRAIWDDDGYPVRDGVRDMRLHSMLFSL